MGTYLSKNEQEISQSLKQEYEVSAQPYLLHKRTQELCILHKITTNSQKEADKIRLIIQEYMQNKCQSINKLRTHYYIDNTGYCSDEQNFYFVFDGQNNYTLREEFAKRRLYRIKFKDEQIEQIIETFLCGLREYDHRFERDYNHLSLDSIVIDKKSKRILLKDPWLASTHSNEHPDPLTSLLLNYPSPQKLRAAFVNKLQDFKEFLSNLFSIGVMALQLNRLEFADSIYNRKKELNYEEIKLRLKQFQSPRLKKGIQCLLDEDPNERKKIFQIWGIQNKEEHFLHPITINEQKSGQNLKVSSKSESNSQNKFRFPSPSNIQQHQPVTQQVIMHPQQIQNNGFKIVEIPSRGNSQPRPFHTSTYIPPMNPYNRRPSQDFIQEAPPQYKVKPYQQPNISFNTTAPSSKVYYPQKLPSFQDYIHSQQIKNHKINVFNNLINPIVYPQTIINQPLPNSILQKRKDVVENKKSYPLQSESFQTHVESPIKQRELNSIMIDTIYENPMKLQRNSSIIQRLHNMEHIQQKINAQHPVNPTHPQQKYIIAAKEIHGPQGQNELIIRDNKQSQSLQKEQLTPQRPIAKTHHNSTIVQVRDEDTPQHSRQSVDQMHQMEYVVEEYETGSKYQGFKSRGMRNGKGKFYYQDGGFYQGQWKDNKMDGYGKLYYEGGKIAYEGYWLQDQFNGMGKVYNDNPIFLDSQFDYTNFDFLEDYWEYYQGMLVRDTKQGRGKIKLSNGQTFQGDFHIDRIHGFGKFRTINGNLIEGIWRDSKLIKVISNSPL